MRRSLVLSCVTLLVASALGAAACTEAGGGRNQGDAGSDAGDASATDEAGDASGGDAEAGDAGDASPVKPTTLDEACDAVATARCTRSDDCTGNIANVVRYGTEERCVAALTAECRVAASLSTATPAAVIACAKAYGAEACPDLESRIVPPECAFKGAKAIGEPCGIDTQCASGFCTASASECGQCAVPPKAEDRCVTTPDCGNVGDLVCVRNHCALRQAKGAPCSAIDRCAPGLSCLVSDAGAFGKCVDAAKAGEACDPASAAAPDCDRSLSLYCGAGRTCVHPQVASSGQVCGNLDGFGFQPCMAGGACVSLDGGPTGTCVMPVEEGQPCSVSAGPLCIGPAVCVRNAGSPERCVYVDPSTCK
jgi:hypothetical protein